MRAFGGTLKPHMQVSSEARGDPILQEDQNCIVGRNWLSVDHHLGENRGQSLKEIRVYVSSK